VEAKVTVLFWMTLVAEAPNCTLSPGWGATPPCQLPASLVYWVPAEPV